MTSIYKLRLIANSQLVLYTIFHMLRSLFKQSSIYFVGLVAGKLLGTIAWIIIARIFTKELTGEVIFFVTLLELTTFIADFGLNQWYLKHAEDHDEKKAYQKVIGTRILTLFLSMIVLTIFLTVSHTFEVTVIEIFILTLIPEALLSIGDSYFLKKKQSYLIAFKGISSILFFFVWLVLFTNNHTFSTIAFMYFVSTAVTLLWFFPWKMIQGIELISMKEAITVLKASSAYALLIVTSYIYARGDSLIVGYIAGPAALGLYGLAYRYLDGLSLFPSALTQNLFPISAKKTGIHHMHLFKMTVTMTTLGIIAGLFLYFCADILIMLLGSQYMQAVPVLRIFAIVLVLYFVNAPLSTVVQSSKFVHSFLPFGITNTVLNLFLNILFVPIYGIYAAAWIMVVTEITGLIINLIFIKKLYNNV